MLVVEGWNGLTVLGWQARYIASKSHAKNAYQACKNAYGALF